MAHIDYNKSVTISILGIPIRFQYDIIDRQVFWDLYTDNFKKQMDVVPDSFSHLTGLLEDLLRKDFNEYIQNKIYEHWAVFEHDSHSAYFPGPDGPFEDIPF